jgi:hypothetical protein
VTFEKKVLRFCSAFQNLTFEKKVSGFLLPSQNLFVDKKVLNFCFENVPLLALNACFFGLFSFIFDFSRFLTEFLKLFDFVKNKYNNV